jgi:surfeit locus 1 family protein
MAFRPAPAPTALVLVALAILIALGTWQLSRNGEALTRLAEIEQRQTSAPIKASDLAKTDGLTWRTADVDGSWTGEPMLMTGRFEFGQVGYDVVQGLAVDGVGTVLVNRGWIPKEGWQQTLAAIQARPPREHVHGLIISLQPESDPGFIRRLIGANHVSEAPISASATDPERFALDAYPGMSKRIPKVLPWVLVAGEPLRDSQQKSQGTWPATGYRLAPKRIPHLQYAVTWFLIAATLVVIWTVRGFQRGQELSRAQ